MFTKSYEEYRRLEVEALRFLLSTLPKLKKGLTIIDLQLSEIQHKDRFDDWPYKYFVAELNHALPDGRNYEVIVRIRVNAPAGEKIKTQADAYHELTVPRYELEKMNVDMLQFIDIPPVKALEAA